MKAWLKGGLIGALISLVIVILYNLSAFFTSNLEAWKMGFGGIIIMFSLIIVLAGFVIGLIIGVIASKIKSKK